MAIHPGPAAGHSPEIGPGADPLAARVPTLLATTFRVVLVHPARLLPLFAGPLAVLLAAALLSSLVSGSSLLALSAELLVLAAALLAAALLVLLAPQAHLLFVAEALPSLLVALASSMSPLMTLLTLALLVVALLALLPATTLLTPALVSRFPATPVRLPTALVSAVPARLLGPVSLLVGLSVRIFVVLSPAALLHAPVTAGLILPSLLASAAALHLLALLIGGIERWLPAALCTLAVAVLLVVLSALAMLTRVLLALFLEAILALVRITLTHGI